MLLNDWEYEWWIWHDVQIFIIVLLSEVMMMMFKEKKKNQGKVLEKKLLREEMWRCIVCKRIRKHLSFVVYALRFLHEWYFIHQSYVSSEWTQSFFLWIFFFLFQMSWGLSFAVNRWIILYGWIILMLKV